MNTSIQILSGRYKGTHLYTLEGLNTRPTTGRVLENLFNILMHNPWNNILFSKHRILDLCAGSGRLSLEALSRGAPHATLIENHKDAQKIIKKNLEKVKRTDCNILGYDVTNLPHCPYQDKFSLVFCDAPYKTDIAEKAITSAYTQGWLCEKALIVIETEKQKEEFHFPFAQLLQRRDYGQSSLHFFSMG